MTPEKARLILDAALQDGSLPLGYLKAMAVGVARSGKTLSKKHVFKMQYDPDLSISTGVCEAPIFAIRKVTWELIKALPSVKGFGRLEHEDINQVVAEAVREGMLQGRVRKVVKEIVKASKGTSSTEISDGVAGRSVGRGSGDSKASTAVISAVCSTSETHREQLFKLQVILFLDSGGQPQFHEVVSAFSHNVSLVLIFIKLNECLDALCTNAFTDEEGRWFRERCPSLLTNEQMVVQFVNTMMCKPVTGSEGMYTRFMVIGTHRDCMHECEENLLQKNERLASLLLPALEENLIRNGKYIIFPVNAKYPDANDQKYFSLIREKVSDVSASLDVDTPVAFLLLLNDINKYAEEQQRRVMSIDECQVVAGRLKMERQTLEAALIHFNQLSIWMYMPSVLPGVVFIDPQMPLDSMNRIVRHSFLVGEGEVELVSSEYHLWKEGVVSSEMLNKAEFCSSFVSGLFDADDALRLFQSLYIVARLNERDFIMPAMLQTVEEKDIKGYLPAASEHVAPLFLHFLKSRIANGVFCSTHTCMRSRYGWKTCYTIEHGERAPACLFRNAVRLQHPNEPVVITFINAIKHFEVHLEAPEADLSRICPEIREVLVDAVKSAMSAFRFKSSQASVAFQCPCSSGEIHPAILNDANSKLICTRTEKINQGGLTAAQKVWLATG